MSGKIAPSAPAYPEYVTGDQPPPYTPFPQTYTNSPLYYLPNSTQTPRSTTVVVDTPTKVFSKMARFDGISKPSIPPPPPGCMPNQYQLMMMQGPVEVVFKQMQRIKLTTPAFHALRFKSRLGRRESPRKVNS